MINREAGLTEIYERIKANRIDLGLVSFKRTPTKPIQENQMPCIFLLEGSDTIVGHSSRGKLNYPAKRVMEVTLELVTNKNTDIKELFRNLRRIVFTERDVDPPQYTPIVAENTFINENRTEGPVGYNLPDVLGMQLVLDLVYMDEGI